MRSSARKPVLNWYHTNFRQFIKFVNIKAVKNLRDATTLDYDRVSGETAVERISRDEKQRREEEYGRKVC